METKEFKYNGESVGFEIEDKNVMVNATQMAKAFGKEVSGFLKIDSTKKFVDAYCRAEDLPSENEFSPSGKLVKVVSVGRNNGTWMERCVAIKFAAWLNPDFEVWVYKTIDEILFGSYIEDEKTLKEIARIQTEMTLTEKALNEHPLQQKMDTLKKNEQKAKKKLELRKKMKISSFRTMFSVEEMSGEEDK